MKSLKDAREARGIKKGAVANAIGVSYPTYRKYEEDTTIMPAGKLADACAFIGVQVEDIFLPTNLN